MGIPELWDIIRDHEEVIPLARLAEEHFKQHGRPLWIAVDEADWRFNNLSQEQVYAIRDTSGEQAFQGIEKAMFWRICKLLTRNIQLIFVFDGPGIPWKRGKRGGGRIDYRKRELLKQMLHCFGIPYQEAPGEAEAECARLQILGLVDAVWSQDSDCLVFGCSFWIHDDRVAKESKNKDRSKHNTKKSDKNVRIVRAKDLKAKLNLDREGFVLFAMLAGGDYNEVGLRGCGAATALSAAEEGTLAQSLCLCRNQRECVEWSYRLAAFLQTKPRARNLPIPANFPDYKILQKYYRPKTTSDELLVTNKSLDLAIPRLIDEHQLLKITSSRFNIWGKSYMKWIGPVLLTRSLLLRHTSCPKEIVHDIKLTKQRASQNEEVVALRSLERKITFSPFGVTTLKRQDFEGGEREGMWDGIRDVPFDPTYRVECDYFPAFLLRQVLPADVFDPPPPAPKQKSSKRKEHPGDSIDGERSMSLVGKKRKLPKSGPVVRVPSVSPSNEDEARQSQIPVVDTRSARTNTSTTDAKRKGTTVRLKPPRPHAKQQATTEPHEVIDLSSLEDEPILRLLPIRRSKESLSLRESLDHIVDLGSPEPSDDGSENLARAVQLNLQSPRLDRNAQDALAPPWAPSIPRTPYNARRVSNTVSLSTSATQATPNLLEQGAGSASKDHGDHSNELDQIRAARLKHFASTPLVASRRATSSVNAAQSVTAAATECIDLTGD